MQLKFPRLEKWQSDVLNSVNNNEADTYVIKSHRQCGKSLLACVLLICASCKQKSVSAVVEPTLSQSRRVFRQLQGMLSKSGIIEKSNESILSFTFINQSEIVFKSAEQGETALRGLTINGSGIMVIDEGAFIDTSIYQVLTNTVTVHHRPIVVFSTPLFKSGWYYELYSAGEKGQHRIKSFDWSTYDTSKYLSDEQKEFYRQSVTPQKFRSDYLGLFLEDNESMIFGDIKKCIKPINNLIPRYGGIDWSNSGGDYTVLTLMNSEKQIVNIYRWQKEEPTQKVDFIAQILNQYPSLEAVNCETNSMGETYISILKTKLLNKRIIKPFATTNESKRRIIENLVVAFQKEDITIINDSELIKELQHYEIQQTKTGNVTYNGNGANDDYVMSLAMCYDNYPKNNTNYKIKRL